MRAIRFDHHGEPIEVLRSRSDLLQNLWMAKQGFIPARFRILASAVNPSVRGHHRAPGRSFLHPFDLKATIPIQCRRSIQVCEIQEVAQ
jgi:hypothetical protein